MDLEKMSVPELESHLNECRDSKPRSYLLEVMAVRNKKIKEAEYDHWGLSEEQYLRACQEAANAGEPVHIHLNKARSALLKEMRNAQSVVAGIADVGVTGHST